MEKSCDGCWYVGVDFSCTYPLTCRDNNRWVAKEEIDLYKQKVQGVGTDCETITNDRGGSQSKIEHLFTDFDARAILRVANVSYVGNKKYGDNNWRKISQKDHINHALTHVFKHLTGEKTSEDDLAHAAWRLLAALGVEYTLLEEVTNEQDINNKQILYRL